MGDLYATIHDNSVLNAKDFDFAYICLVGMFILFEYVAGFSGLILFQFAGMLLDLKSLNIIILSHLSVHNPDSLMLKVLKTFQYIWNGFLQKTLQPVSLRKHSRRHLRRRTLM